MKPRTLSVVLVLLALLLTAPAAQATRTSPHLGALTAAELPPPLPSRSVLAAGPTPALPLLSPKDRAISAALASLDEPERARLLGLRRFRLTTAAAPLSRLEPLVWGQKTASGRFFAPGAPNLWETRLFNPASRQGDLFLEPDPLGPVDSPNLYQAFGFDGLNVRDPFGECWFTGDNVPCSVYLKEAAKTFFSQSPKDSIARAKAAGKFLWHEAKGAVKFGLGLAKAAPTMVMHPLESLKAAGDALSGPSEAFRGFLDHPTETLEALPENIQEFGYNLSVANADEAGEKVGGTLAGVVALEAGARAFSAAKGSFVEGPPAAVGGVQQISRATGLPNDVLQLTERNLTNSGDAVLGSFPGYIEKAQARNASYFDIGKTAWDSLSDTQRWAANRHFLDIVSSRGDRVLLSIPKTKIESGTWLAREVQYLTKERGYVWVNQWALKPGK